MDEVLERKVIKRAETYYAHNVYNSKFECVRMAIGELVSVGTLSDIFTLFDITLDQLIESIVPKVEDYRTI
mgnify:CR=1 FL=1